MKTLSARLTAAVLLAAAIRSPLWAVDSWQQKFSFPLTSNTGDAGRGVLFNDPADGFNYAYYGANTASGAQVFRSSDGVSWNQVNVNGFGTSGGQPIGTGVAWISTYNNGVANYLYVGVAQNAAISGNGAQIYKSAGGASTNQWTLVFDTNTTRHANDATPGGGNAVSFNGALYAGTKNNASGGEVWKSTSADWTGAWIQTSTKGFGGGAAENANVSYLKAFGGNLYAATNCAVGGPACGQLWKSTGTVTPTDVDTWTQVLSGSTTFDANTHSISALESFNGFLYATTYNTGSGAQMFRTATPNNAASWTQVFSPDTACGSCFGTASSKEIHALRAVNGILYASTWDPTNGLYVYRSTDGVTWTQSITGGFGAAANQFLGDFVPLAAKAYSDTFNTGGGALWAASLPSPAFTSFSAQISSIAATFGSVGATANGLDVDASTAANFTGTLYSSATANTALLTLAPQTLDPNTTYFLRVGALWGGATSYSNSNSLATLAQPPVPLATTFLSIFQTSATVAWAAFRTGVVSSATSEGYTLQASSVNFAAGGTTLSSATANVLASTLTAVGLLSNSTYYFRVGSLNWGGSLSLTVLGSTVTQPAPPGAQAFSAVTSSGIGANWTNGGNSNLTALTYTAVFSTGALPNAFSGNITSVTFSTFAFFGLGGIGGNLTPNTTYFVQVNSTSTFWPSLVTQLGSTVTLANAPVASSATVYFSSITLSWLANGNPAGTTYYALVSTGPTFATLSQTATTQSNSVWLTNLAANTTYYGAVYAANRNGTQSAYATYTAASTFVVAPGTAAATGRTISTMTINWNTAGNSPTTVYTVKLSSDGFITAVFTATTTLSSSTFSGLVPNTLYQSSVSAMGNNGAATAFVGMPSTYTLILSPGVNASTTYLTVDVSSLTLTWNSGGNPAGTIYVAQISSGAFPNGFSGNLSSNTLNTSVLFGAGGAGPNLNPNTTYYCQVFSSAGVNTSAFIGLDSTATLAAQPSGTTVVAASSMTVSLSWTANGNPLLPPTTYELWVATEPTFSAPVKNTTGTAAYLVSGLTPLTTYYFKPRAKNFNGLFTLFDVAVTTMTTPPQPGAPGTPAGTAIGVSSISWTWTLASNATSYSVFLATNTSFFIGSSSFTGFVETNLAPNTTYSIVTLGVDSGGPGTLSAAAPAVYTLAFPPVGVSSPTVKVTSAVVTWGLNGNPAGTTAKVERSTDNVNYTSVFSTTSLTFTDTTLLGCSTYFYRVKNTNGGGIDTGYASSLQFNTQGSTPLPAGSLSAASIAGNLVSLAWTPSPFEGITRYRLFYDAGTSTVSYAAPLAVFTSTETSYTTGALASTAAYTFALRATNRCGIEETTGVFASAASTSALSSVRAALTSPQSGANVGIGASAVLTLTAGLTAGTPLSVSQVVFQYKAVLASTWTVISTSTLLPYTTSWSIAGITAGTSLNLRAVAYDLSGNPDSSPGAITVNFIDPATSPLAQQPGFTTEVVGVGVSTKTLVVSNMAPTTASMSTLGSDGTVRTTTVLLPTGSFGGGLPNSTGTLTLVTKPSGAPDAPTGATAAGISAQIFLTGANLSGSATLTFSYSDPTNIGLIGTVGVAQVRLYSSREGSGVWLNDLQTTVDTVNHTISGVTSHFTFFAGFAVPAADASGIRVYPIPWKPNGTSADEGKPYAAGDPTSGIIFDRLPGTVVIKIYTMTGQPVAKFSQENGPGILQWDGKNDSNRDVASGLYVAVISGPGFQTVTRKILIIR